MKLSVMMITYNHEGFIAQAIQSVLDQQVDFEYEIVIGEDYSTDRTREIVMDFCRRYPERIVALLPNRNQGMMRNALDTLMQCRGEFVAFLEGDDYWVSLNKLQRQVDFLEAHPDYAVCCGRVSIADEMNPTGPRVAPPNPEGAYTITDLLQVNFIYTCTSVCRWNLKSLPKWLCEVKLGDWPIHALIAQSGKIELMDEVLAVYRVHSGSGWSSRSLISRHREAARMLEALNRELQFKYEHILRGTIAHLYYDCATAAMKSHSRIEAGQFLINCLLHDGYARFAELRPSMRGLAGYILLGSWLPAISKAKRAILG